MPEGPEIHLSSHFINSVCKGRLFGPISKSEISKNPPVATPFEKFTITASSRGKELKVSLLENLSGTGKLDILFTFGLAGKFDWIDADRLEKHSHLNFITCDDQPKKALSFIDYMRFGKWVPGADFSFKERGPCPLLEYSDFRKHVLSNLSNAAFNKPICEALLNQKFFNGIGNYLRAEVLHRANIPPFVCARTVLESLSENAVVKSEEPDLLQLCSVLQQEVVQLEGSWYDGSDRNDTSNAFNSWLQCYYKEGMKNTVDHNKRTIWYSGPLGPMAPKDGKVRARKVSKKKKGKDEEHEGNVKEEKADGEIELVISDEASKSRSKRAKGKKRTEQIKVKTSAQDFTGNKNTKHQQQEAFKAVEDFTDGIQKPASKRRKNVVEKKSEPSNEKQSSKDRSRKRKVTSTSNIKNEEKECSEANDSKQNLLPSKALQSGGLEETGQPNDVEDSSKKKKKRNTKPRTAPNSKPVLTDDAPDRPSSAKRSRLSRNTLQRSRSKSRR